MQSPIVCQACDKSTTEIMFSSCSPIPLADIKTATNDFHESTIIGDGTEGIVYKGVFDYGQEKITAAVQRLKDPMNCDIRGEVRLLSKLKCPQVVSLLGHCQESGEKILVYEYIPNGNLYTNLHQTYAPFLWEQRLKICIDAAIGLYYLHNISQTERIIHRDVKTLNILLNENWEAKIADFGLSKKDAVNELQSEITTKNRNGTPLYQPPELVDKSKSLVSRETDVYSFGVVLVEILSRTIPFDDHDDEEDGTTAKWAKLCIKKGKHQEMIDYELDCQISPNSLKLFLDLIALCLDDETSKRPVMKEVVTTLESALDKQLNFVHGKKIREDAARIMQMAYRAYQLRSFQVRCALRDLAVAKSKLMDLRQIFNSFYYRRWLARDAEERQRFSAKIVSLIVTVDWIKGPALMVRTSKTSTLDKLEEMLNVVDPSPTRMTRKRHTPDEEPNGETFEAAFANISGALMKRKELSRHDAAMILQMAYRAHVIRHSQPLHELRQLAICKSKLMDIQGSYNHYAYCHRLARDAEEKQRFVEKIVVLILTVNWIEAPAVMVRTAKQSILGKLEEMLDVVDPSRTVMGWRRTKHLHHERPNHETYEAAKRAVELEKMKENAKHTKEQEAKRAGKLKKMKNMKGRRHDLSPMDAAMTLQMKFRANLVRKSLILGALCGILSVEVKLKELRTLFSDTTYRSSIASDARERQRFCDKIMLLLLTVDAIEGADVLTRTARISMIRELEEILDIICPQTQEETQRGGSPMSPTMTFKRNFQLLASDLRNPTPVSLKDLESQVLLFHSSATSSSLANGSPCLS